MPNSASGIAELATGLQSYRGEIADALRTSLAFVERYLSLWGIDDRFDAATGMRDHIDLSRGMRAIVGPSQQTPDFTPLPAFARTT